jgi:hypothetical protein
MSEKLESPQIVVDPAHQISGPFVGLLLTGIIGAIFSIGTLIALSIGTGLSSIAERYSDWAEEIPWGIEEFYQGAFAFGFSIIAIFIAALIIYAALKMKDLKHWGLAVAASILAMIPCISPCCIIGLPIGIWCLVVLMKPEVKEAFD